MTRPAPGPSLHAKPLHVLRVDRPDGLPPGLDIEQIVTFFHESMRPWEDSPEDIRRALGYAWGEDGRPGGFLLLALDADELVGALLILNTGMGGYVPAHLLLFVGVAPARRGQGIGRKLVERAQRDCPGAIKLHVEYENPARRLYERLGFRSSYAEMRYQP